MWSGVIAWIIERVEANAENRGLFFKLVGLSINACAVPSNAQGGCMRGGALQ